MSKLLRELSKPDSEALRSEALEQLKVTSGKIIACDPLIFNENHFEQTIQPGTYPIVAWWHKEDGVIAGAELKLSESKAVGWKMATKPGQNVSELEDGYIFGYPVDTSLGCFADVEAIGKLEEIEDRLQQELGEEFTSLYDDLIDDILTEHDEDWEIAWFVRKQEVISLYSVQVMEMDFILPIGESMKQEKSFHLLLIFKCYMRKIEDNINNNIKVNIFSFTASNICK